MKRVWFFLALGVVSLCLPMTIFSQTVLLGPIFLTISLFSFGYSLFLFYKRKPHFGQVIIEAIGNLLTFPFTFH